MKLAALALLLIIASPLALADSPPLEVTFTNPKDQLTFNVIAVSWYVYTDRLENDLAAYCAEKGFYPQISDPFTVPPASTVSWKCTIDSKVLSKLSGLKYVPTIKYYYGQKKSAVMLDEIKKKVFDDKNIIYTPETSQAISDKMGIVVDQLTGKAQSCVEYPFACLTGNGEEQYDCFLKDELYVGVTIDSVVSVLNNKDNLENLGLSEDAIPMARKGCLPKGIDASVFTALVKNPKPLQLSGGGQKGITLGKGTTETQGVKVLVENSGDGPVSGTLEWYFKKEGEDDSKYVSLEGCTPGNSIFKADDKTFSPAQITINEAESKLFSCGNSKDTDFPSDRKGNYIIKVEMAGSQATMVYRGTLQDYAIVELPSCSEKKGECMEFVCNKEGFAKLKGDYACCKGDNKICTPEQNSPPFMNPCCISVSNSEVDDLEIMKLDIGVSGCARCTSGKCSLAGQQCDSSGACKSKDESKDVCELCSPNGRYKMNTMLDPNKEQCCYGDRSWCNIDNGACYKGVWYDDHCFDGVQDCDETGVDCGGANCGTCPKKSVGTGNISLVVYFDENWNGQMDEGESLVGGKEFSVKLTGVDSVYTDTKQADSSGNLEFNSLKAGTYIASFSVASSEWKITTATELSLIVRADSITEGSFGVHRKSSPVITEPVDCSKPENVGKTGPEGSKCCQKDADCAAYQKTCAAGVCGANYECASKDMAICSRISCSEPKYCNSYQKCLSSDEDKSVCEKCSGGVYKYNYELTPPQMRCCYGDRSWCNNAEGGICADGVWSVDHCMDKTQDCDETGVDCGGARCKPCIGEKLPEGKGSVSIGVFFDRNRNSRFDGGDEYMADGKTITDNFEPPATDILLAGRDFKVTLSGDNLAAPVEKTLDSSGKIEFKDLKAGKYVAEFSAMKIYDWKLTTPQKIPLIVEAGSVEEGSFGVRPVYVDSTCDNYIFERGKKKTSKCTVFDRETHAGLLGAECSLRIDGYKYIGVAVDEYGHCDVTYDPQAQIVAPPTGQLTKGSSSSDCDNCIAAGTSGNMVTHKVTIISPVSDKTPIIPVNTNTPVPPDKSTGSSSGNEYWYVAGCSDTCTGGSCNWYKGPPAMQFSIYTTNPCKAEFFSYICNGINVVNHVAFKVYNPESNIGEEKDGCVITFKNTFGDAGSGNMPTQATCNCQKLEEQRCVDMDGEDPFVKGSAYILNSDGSKKEEKIDDCADDYTAREYTCNSQNEITYYDLNCAQAVEKSGERLNYKCYDGLCLDDCTKCQNTLEQLGKIKWWDWSTFDLRCNKEKCSNIGPECAYVDGIAGFGTCFFS
jgi:hypothetical protein